jgi:hypothetical protein
MLFFSVLHATSRASALSSVTSPGVAIHTLLQVNRSCDRPPSSTISCGVQFASVFGGDTAMASSGDSLGLSLSETVIDGAFILEQIHFDVSGWRLNQWAISNARSGAEDDRDATVAIYAASMIGE